MSRPPADLPRSVDVFEAARTAAVLQGHVSLASFDRLRPSMPVLRGELAYRFDAHIDARGRPAARLSFSARVPLVCDRCGTVVDLPLTGAGNYYFVRSEAELARIPVDDSEDEPLLGSSRFDLMELLEDELILALPISPKHEDCAQTVTLPEPEAASAPVERLHPFASLASFKPRRQ